MEHACFYNKPISSKIKLK